MSAGSACGSKFKLLVPISEWCMDICVSKYILDQYRYIYSSLHTFTNYLRIYLRYFYIQMSSCYLRTSSIEKNDSYFIQYANNITSQGGEDGIIKKIFELIDDGTTQRVCVDIGAYVMS